MPSSWAEILEEGSQNGDELLIVAALLSFAIGVVHSYLGERFILTRLFRETRIPRLFGSDLFTKRTLRFAWHLTTLAWWGLGVLIWAVSRQPANLDRVVLLTVGTVFLISGGISLFASRGRHLSWIVFWLISVLVFFSALTG